MAKDRADQFLTWLESQDLKTPLAAKLDSIEKFFNPQPIPGGDVPSRLSIGGLTQAIDSAKRDPAAYAGGWLGSIAEMFARGADARFPGTQNVERLHEIVRGTPVEQTGTPGSELGGIVGIPGIGTTISAIAKAKGIGSLPLLGGVMTYHGTPHTWAPEPGFPKGRFRLDKIGTGEGTAMRGKGAYVAENPDVATTYNPLQFDVVPTRPLAEHEGDAWSKAYITMIQQKGDVDAAVKSLENQRRIWERKTGPDVSAAQWQIPRIDQAIDLVRSGVAQVKRNPPVKAMDLPDEVLPKMMEYDKPMREQSESVTAALKKLGIYGEHGSIDDVLTHLGSTTSYLRDVGIPGVSFLDAGSRAAGKGTKNHVIWDQDLLDRMARAAAEMR